MNSFNVAQLAPVSAEIFLVLVGMAMLILGAFRDNDKIIRQIGMAEIAIIFASMLLLVSSISGGEAFFGMLVLNDFTLFAKMLVLGATFVALYLSSGYYRENMEHGVNEYPVIVLFSAVGMMVMISSGNLLTLYMGLEMQSLALYVLASLHRDDVKSSEAGLKYFVLGALASGIILYGSSLVYGFSGTIDFKVLSGLYNEKGNLPIGALVGLVFVISGIFFKISAAPFHMWTPDVYEGSPMPVTAYFASAPKVAGVAFFLRFLLEPFGKVAGEWQQIVIVVSVLTMVIGALGALMQTNIKRLLAYSSIGHVGVMLVGVATASQSGARAVMFYLLVYITMSLGMFAAIMMVKHKDGKSEEISSFSGLSKTRPMLALVIAILMLSMAGIPPFAGFFAKFFVFYAAVESGFYTLAVIGVLSSVISAFYYLKIIKVMYFDELNMPLDKNTQVEMKVVAIGSAAFNLLFFISFSHFLNSAGKAVAVLF